MNPPRPSPLRPTWRHALAACALLLATAPSLVARAQDLTTLEARRATLDFDFDAAAKILDEAGDDEGVAIERGRLALYVGDCDAAVRHLSRTDVEDDTEGAMLLSVARGCARGTAATLTLSDEAAGVTVRFQDDEDIALFPVIVSTAVAARDMLARELESELPKPLRIDLVRDQFTLAALSGLPEEAAQTTGAIAVAKFGRVLQVSPRAAPHGYPWLDTLAHELTHLAISKKSRDRAPLWLQEGVAKRQETRWRAPGPLDDVPSHDAVAAIGIARGLGVKLDEIGPSIAMLPSAEQASVAFAEVASFIRYVLRQNGDGTLPKLLVAMRDAPLGGEVDTALKSVTGKTLKQWDERWRAEITTKPHELPLGMQPGSMPPEGAAYAKKLRLAELLRGRNHLEVAAIEAARAHALMPAEPGARVELVLALLGLGRDAEATVYVADPALLHGASGRYWSLHAKLVGDGKGTAARRALALDPLGKDSACEELAPPAVPTDPIRAFICQAARRVPR